MNEQNYTTIVVKGLPGDFKFEKEVMGCPVIAVTHCDATEKIERLEAAIENLNNIIRGRDGTLLIDDDGFPVHEVTND